MKNLPVGFYPRAVLAGRICPSAAKGIFIACQNSLFYGRRGTIIQVYCTPVEGIILFKKTVANPAITSHALLLLRISGPFIKRYTAPSPLWAYYLYRPIFFTVSIP
jgi:hypothetical protein